jgi:hypothetical protein
MDTRTRAHGRAPASLTIPIIATTVLGLCGCAKPLFSPEDQRTQFDRFDAVRNQYEPQSFEDEYGQRRPNLRGRLLPKG